jgi:hypothetical protein
LILCIGVRGILLHHIINTWQIGDKQEGSQNIGCKGI